MEDLKEQLIEEFGENCLVEALGELTLTVNSDDIIKTCFLFRYFD